jgi:hypothetical protein
MLLEMFAVSGGYPTASRTGNVMRLPEPTIALITPAAAPAAAITTPVSTCTRREYA